MDNQFRRKAREAFANDEPTEEIKPDDSLIDLYDNDKKPIDDGKLDPEVEELKKLAQSDALRAYGWIRAQLNRLGVYLARFKQPLSPKRKKLVKLSALSVVVLVIGLKFIPPLVRNLTEKSDVLGDTQTTPDFDTLQPDTDTNQPVIFDSTVGVAIYKDQIDGVEAIISQQPLPEDVKGQAGLENLALSLQDKISISQLQTDKGAAYVAITGSDGNITIFSYQELLIFIRTNTLVDNDSWMSYINGLR